MRLTRSAICTTTVLMLTAALAAQPPQGGGRGRGGQPRAPRDMARPVPAGTGVITGRVVAAETGRPVKRARVVAAGAGRPFTATTDDQGRYRLTGLPSASYTVTATKTGFVAAIFGQRRVMRPGTPLELADAQQLSGIDLRLARGGVIAGRILDEDGEPLAQAMVTVLRQQYVRGEKQMTPVGADQSDDRGQFRVFGLPPGDYYVSATAGGVERLFRQLIPAAGQGEEAPDSTGYAATYHPGVIAPTEATRIRLAAAQEITTVEFGLQLVVLSTVRGVVSGGAPANVMLLPEGSAAGGGGGRGGRGGLGALGGAIGGALRGQMLRAGTQADGTFSIPNVTPGRYTIIARAGDPQGPGSTAVQPLLVAGEEVIVSLSPAPGVAVSGTVTLEAEGIAAPKGLAGFRVTALPLGAVAALPRAVRPASAGEGGEFTLDDVVPGHYLLRGVAPQGWTMKAVYVDGRDATDQAIEIKSATLTGVNVIFTNRLTSLSGVVRDAKASGSAGLTVVAFSADDALWFPQSRHIQTARSGADGAYRLNALPAGDYLVVAVDDIEQGEWFDPAFLEQMRERAVKVTLGEGAQKTQDLKAPE